MNALVSIFIRLLEALFVIGALGSLAVVAVTTVEDMEVILAKDKDESPQAPVE